MKSIKICICGLSCAGKTTLAKALEKQYKMEFLEGSRTLCQLGGGISREELKAKSPQEKLFLRKQFITNLRSRNDRSIILVDGHYSFLLDNGFDVAMSELDFTTYNVILYLYTPIEELQQRIYKRDGKYFSLKDLQKWHDFELNGLKEKCRQYGVFFSVMDNNIECVAAFINEIANKPQYIIPQKIFSHFISVYSKPLNQQKTLILTDCDGTLSTQNAVKEFYKNKSVENYKVLDAFIGHQFYGYYQFFRLTQKRLETDTKTFLEISRKVAESIVLNANLINAICASKFPTIAISAGIRAIWKMVFKKHNIPFLLVAPNRLTTICEDTKTYFAREFINRGYRVIAIGNDRVDSGMLQCASRAILVEESVSIRNDLSQVELITQKSTTKEIERLLCL